MPHRFRLASYNILADAYLRADRYPASPPEVLESEHRRTALLDRLTTLDADIACLQEVEQDVFAFLEARLATLGYAGRYARKGRGKADGCATFYRQGVLSLIASSTLSYSDGTGHVALLTVFRGAGYTLRVANTHLKWDHPTTPTADHQGYRQARELIAVLASAPATYEATVICGDLNVVPDSGVVALLAANGFADAYHGFEQPTCNANQDAKRLDYLWYQGDLTVSPMVLSDISYNTPLPSAAEPSDHLAIAATFTMP